MSAPCCDEAFDPSQVTPYLDICKVHGVQQVLGDELGLGTSCMAMKYVYTPYNSKAAQRLQGPSALCSASLVWAS